ncbi:hypothetical protein U9M48_006078 [Paspalum notatum var. saurae]|uniref:DUF4220 domain-containing protein n=1 Tax=Paspalum notatum var. saurae TaxID=547442 RepID=A0AAQ3SFX3_PASNO
MAGMSPPPLKYSPCHNPQQGLVSEEALRIIVEAKACFVALSLALAYILTASQHRLWSSSHLVKGFLFAVTQPVTRFLLGMFTMLLAMPFRNDLYLLWGILLLAGYEGVCTISGYGVSARGSDLAVHEFARAYNIVVLGLYARYYSRASQFRFPIWALWALMVAKFLERIVRFKIASGRYGDASTSFVADYMKHEDKIKRSKMTSSSSTGTADGSYGFSLEDCNYLIVGDSKSKKAGAERVDAEYEAKYKPVEDTVTVAKVWECDGSLLKSSKTTPENNLKDVCLSFALCKLLRRKFAGVATSESERPKAQRLVFDNLIASGWERTFRVVRTELGFARDLLYTKYPILFCSGFPVVSAALFAVTIGVSVWITVSAVRHYRVPHGSTSNVVHGRNVDLLITFVIVVMVTGMEVCEFFIHLFSDWTKVMLISEYVRKPWLRRPCFLNSVLKLICCCKIAEPIGSSLGQFDLLKSTKEQRCLPECVVKLYHTARSFVLLTGDEDFRINKRKTLRPVPDAVMEMLCKTLQDNNGLKLKGRGHEERPRTRTALEELLSRYRQAPVTIEAIMVCHVATSELEYELGARNDGEEGKDDLEKGRRRSDGWSGLGDYYKLVATTLSRHCAYLVFYKPKLLPVAGNSVRYMCNILVDEAKALVGEEEEEAAANGGEEKAHSDQQDGGKPGIVRRGQNLGRDLGKQARAQGDGLMMWKALAELWCELIVSMAPHGNISAHQKELGKGGEFITHLWALLYHAGIDDKFSGESTGARDAAPSSREENYSQSGAMC